MQFVKIHDLSLFDVSAKTLVPVQKVVAVAWIFKSFWTFGVDHCGNTEPVLSFYFHAFAGPYGQPIEHISWLN